MLSLPTIAVLVLALPSVAAAATTQQPAPVPAQIKLTTEQAKLLWATVNICDTVDHPDTIGVAASMPIIKRATKLYMRFRLQYRDETTKTFKPVPGINADSGWTQLETRKGKARRAGFDFRLFPPQSGAYVVRAVVAFQWRRGRDLLLSASRFTTLGHPQTRAADPKRFSAAVCAIE